MKSGRPVCTLITFLLVVVGPAACSKAPPSSSENPGAATGPANARRAGGGPAGPSPADRRLVEEAVAAKAACDPDANPVKCMRVGNEPLRRLADQRVALPILAEVMQGGDEARARAAAALVRLYGPGWGDPRTYSAVRPEVVRALAAGVDRLTGSSARDAGSIVLVLAAKNDLRDVVRQLLRHADGSVRAEALFHSLAMWPDFSTDLEQRLAGTPEDRQAALNNVVQALDSLNDEEKARAICAFVVTRVGQAEAERQLEACRGSAPTP